MPVGVHKALPHWGAPRLTRVEYWQAIDKSLIVDKTVTTETQYQLRNASPLFGFSTPAVFAVDRHTSLWSPE
jgi:hypothetical protein